MTETAAPAWAAARMVRAGHGHETRTLLLNSAALVFARFGQSVPASEAAFDDLVDAVTVMYLRPLGI